MEKKKPWIGKLLMEFASVVFAVLLALGLNHWREAETERKIAEKALVNIFLEIHANLEDLSAEIPDYDKRMAEIKVYKASFDRGEQMPYSLGYNIPLLSNSAWNVAKSTGAIKDFEMSLLMKLSAIYTFQDMYQSNGMAYLARMNSVEFKQEENAKAIINSNYGQLNTTKAWSIQLIDLYKEFLSEYRKDYQQLLPDSLLVD